MGVMRRGRRRSGRRAGALDAAGSLSIALSIALAVALVLDGEARANPLSIGRFGGLAADASSTDAFALYWNPAGLARPGWDAAASAMLIARQASYDRDATLNHVPDALVGVNSGTATVGTAGVVPALAARLGRSFAGGRLDGAIGLGAWVSTGGTAAWDKNLAAPSGAPGAVDGPQRFASIAARLLVGDVALGAALRHRPSGLALGATLLVEYADFSTVRARDIDGTDQLYDAEGHVKEGRAYFHGSGAALSLILGARWEPSRAMTLAAAYQLGARFHLDGDLRVVFGGGMPAVEKSSVDLPIADTLRVTMALSPTPRLTLRPTLEWNRWSILREHVFRGEAGSPLQTFPRQSSDGYAAKLRADLALSPRLAVSVGGGLEKGPTPSRTMEPGFGEGDSVEGGAAVRVTVGHVAVRVSALFQYFLPFVVTDSITQPSANGTYRDQREMLIVDAELH